MTLTILFDLDDTLLDSNMDNFIPAYFQALSDFLSDLVEPQVMLSALMAGTRKMMVNTDPARTLQQVFDREFFPMLAVNKDDLQERFDQFYREVFPTLSYLTRHRPEAVSLVEWALDQGYQLAISTNPLFPQAAIHHRMRWAGLPPEEYPFVVVSSYESFHFAKPNPAYFAEVLGRMGWPEGAIVMVGDDPERDLPGGGGLGLPTFWICDQDAVLPEGLSVAGRGSIGEVRSWLQERDMAALVPSFSSTEAVLALSLSTPAALQGLLIHLLDRMQFSEADLTQHPDPGEWSLTEILCHMYDTELEINLPRFRSVLDEDEPFLPAPDTARWPIEREYNSQNVEKIVHGFVSARKLVYELLQGLSPVAWQRKARHAIFGPTDLQELAKFMTDHDRLHIQQFWGTMSRLTR